MRCLFLSTVIGALSATCVVVVAALTLSVALPLALRSINANSETAVLRLGRSAVTALDQTLHIPADSVTEAAARIISMGTTHAGLPTETPGYNWTTGAPALPTLRQTIHTIGARGNYAYYVISISTLDAMSCFGFGGARRGHLFEVYCIHPNEGGIHAQPVHQTVSMHNKSDGAFNAPETARMMHEIEMENGTAPPHGSYADPGYRAAWQGWRAGPFPKDATLWGAPMIFSTYAADTVDVAHSVSAPVRNQTHTFGIAFVLFDTTDTAKLLNAARLSSGSEVFMFDKDMYIVSASDGLQTHTIDNFTDHDESKGCTTTRASARLHPSRRERRVCRFHLSSSPHRALTDAFTALPSLFTNPPMAGGIRLVKGWFVFVQPLSSVKYGFTMSLAVITPRKDLLGDADKILPISLAVTSVAVLIAAAVAFAIVRVVLSPLTSIAARMEQAARLEEDADGEALSPLAEIGDLQRSFFLLKNELARLRAFVPQSLLRAQSCDDSENGCSDMNTVSGSEDPGALSSGKPSRTPSSASPNAPLPILRGSLGRTSALASPPSSHGDGSGVAGHAAQYRDSRPEATQRTALNLAVGVKQESVTVLVLNLRGFHRTVASGVVSVAFENLVTTVLDAVQQEKGVVDSFNGDRFLVSFNAARMAAGHSIRAAKVACRVSAALSADHSTSTDRDRYRLPLTAGIATGHAQVGNLGSVAMKRFCIIGPVVSQAAVLERMCKLYCGVHCLVPQRLFEDLSSAVAMETVDYVRLPGSKGVHGTLIGSVTAELSAAGDDEWMYQLEQQQGGGSVGKNAGAAAVSISNEAWAEMVKGQIEPAAAKMALLRQMTQPSPSAVNADSREQAPSAAMSFEERHPRGERIGPRTSQVNLYVALATARDRETTGLSPALLPTALGPFYAAATDTW